MGAAMNDLPFDLTDPPDDPPPAVRQPVMWRVAICLFRDHAPGLAGAGVLARCRTCGQVWPCRCRRFAERALIDACAPEQGTNTPEDSGTTAGGDSTTTDVLGSDPR
jgi:hypothetical protein